MADKTTGELTAVNVSDLTAAADIYDDFKMPGEFQGEAVHVTGGQMKQYAVSSVKPFADSAGNDAATAKTAAASAELAKTASQSALAGIHTALNNLPAGDTLIINDLTTGGATAALSAEMGKTLAQRPNPNLFHNWCFANCVNQRGQTVYANSLSSFVYSIDRHKHNYGTVTIGDGFINYTTESAAAYKRFVQITENSVKKTEIYTLSMLCDVKALSGSVRVRPVNGSLSGLGTAVTISSTGLQLIKTTFNPTSDSATVGAELVVGNTAAAMVDVDIYAWKLERGSEQTLAHYDGSKWVLNEIPDYGDELLKCQRYYQLFTTADKRPTDNRDFRPELRINATSSNTGTIVIDGVTYYYADAGL